MPESIANVSPLPGFDLEEAGPREGPRAGHQGTVASATQLRPSGLELPPVTTTCVLCVSATQSVRLCDPVDGGPPGSSAQARNSPGKNTGVDSHSLLQGISPPQGLNLGLLHCRRIFYHLLLLLSRFSRVRLCDAP